MTAIDSISALNMPQPRWNVAALKASANGRAEEDFERFLHHSAPSSSNGADENLRDAATKLVASALVLPALSSLHQSPLRPQSGPFAPATAEKRFGPLLDVQYADRITKASRFGLVDAIVNRLSSNTKKGAA